MYLPRTDPGALITILTIQQAAIPVSRIHAAMPHLAQRDTSHRDAADITPSRIQGALITAATNPRNHAASRPKGREPSGSNRYHPKPDPGLQDYYYHNPTSRNSGFTNPRRHAASSPHGGVSPREVTDTRSSRDQGSLITAITNPGKHAASRPKGREPSGSDIHHPKTEPGLPDYCQHESRQLCRIQPHRGPSPRDATDIIPGRNQGSQITAITNPGNYAASSPKGARALGIAADIIPGRNQGSQITASTNR